MKWIFNLPQKGRNSTIDHFFEKIHPEHLVINNYIKNYNKWLEIEQDRILERGKRNEEDEEIKFYQSQFINATQLIPRMDMQTIIEEEYYNTILDRIINGWTN